MLYVWGARGIDDICYRLDNRNLSNDSPTITYNNVWYHLTDGQGSTVAVTDSTAKLVERLAYDAYGGARHQPKADLNGDGATTTGSGGEVNAIRTLGLANSGAGTPITASTYNPDADLNRDGTVTSADYTLAQAAPGSGTGGVTTAAAPGMLNYAASGSGVLPGGGVTDNIVGYCGYLFNAEVPGGGMYTVRFRNYDPGIGRWLERDPAGYVDGMSLYGYCGGGPVGCSDPSGLISDTDLEYRNEPWPVAPPPDPYHYEVPGFFGSVFGSIWDNTGGAILGGIGAGLEMGYDRTKAMYGGFTGDFGMIMETNYGQAIWRKTAIEGKGYGEAYWEVNYLDPRDAVGQALYEFAIKLSEGDVDAVGQALRMPFEVWAGPKLLGSAIGEVAKLAKGALRGAEGAEAAAAAAARAAGGEAAAEGRLARACDPIKGPCFPPGTQILMADGTTKAIERVEPGDFVLADDPEDDAGPEAHQVTGVLENYTFRLIHVEIDRDGDDVSDGEFAATGFHPIWVLDRGWVYAMDLAAGGLLASAGCVADSEPQRVVEVCPQRVPTVTYNLVVEGVPTFFVACNNGLSILVRSGQGGPSIASVVGGTHVSRGGGGDDRRASDNLLNQIAELGSLLDDPNLLLGISIALVAIPDGGNAPGHHIATDKYLVRPEQWTARFEKIFGKARMTLQDDANIVKIAGHQGPHPQSYHELVFERLTSATKDLKSAAYRKALLRELNLIGVEANTPGTELNKMITNPRFPGDC